MLKPSLQKLLFINCFAARQTLKITDMQLRQADCGAVQEEEAAGGAAEEQPQQEAGPDEDAEYEYMEDGGAREAGETQALGPATEEQAAELHGANRPEQGALPP